MASADPDTRGQSDRGKLEEMRFLWWEINGDDSLAMFPKPPETNPGTTGALMSCEDALINAKEYVIEGELDKAAVPVRYLQERGYADPAFIQFCTIYDLCPG